MKRHLADLRAGSGLTTEQLTEAPDQAARSMRSNVQYPLLVGEPTPVMGPSLPTCDQSTSIPPSAFESRWPLAGLLLAAAAAPVSAHEHFRVVGNGDCVAIAVAGAESAVVLPDAVWNNPNVDVPMSGPRHPLHLFVHKGVPGDHNTIGVIGTTACPGAFLNTR